MRSASAPPGRATSKLLRDYHTRILTSRVHRGICKHTQANRLAILERALDPNTDPAWIKEVTRQVAMQSLLRDFIEAHRTTFRSYATARIFFEGGAEGLFAKGGDHVLLLPLHLDPPPLPPGASDLDIDPSRAFKLKKSAFIPLERFVAGKPQLQSLWDSSADHRRELAEGQRHNKEYVGTIMVVYKAEEEVMKAEFYTMSKTFNNPDTPGRHPCEACEKIQMEGDVKFMEWGLVWRPDPAKGDEDMVPGYLKKVGSTWRWTKLFEDVDREPGWLASRPGPSRMKFIQDSLAAAGGEL